MECWVREIHLRACVRIGELVRELDTAQGERVDLTSSGQPEQVAKKQALADAGIPQSTAYDYQALAGGRDERAQAAGKAASEHYYAQSRAKSEPPTMAGLGSAVREAWGIGAAEDGRVQGALRAERAKVDFLEGRGKHGSQAITWHPMWPTGC